MPKKSDKAPRLIEAAATLIYQRGLDQTTLAHIAEKADVPLGNVYYYFKTKEMIAEAVIKKLLETQRIEFEALNQHTTDPFERLVLALEIETAILEQVARYGCPVGTLCQELAKQRGLLANQAAKLLHECLEWCELQFRNLGFGKKAAELALYFVAHLQGTYLLIHTLKDPKIFANQAILLKQWLSALRSGLPGRNKVAELA